MGKPPSTIFVVRHGARLDAADPQWHLSSPSPYDPPLTYGGWKQAQALGARIASLIRQREDDSELSNPMHPDGSDQSAKRRRRRRHKVVVHSSPFLRCIQTSIAINAGMDHWIGQMNYEEKEKSPKQHHLHSGVPHVQALDGKNSPQLSAIPEPNAVDLQTPVAPGESESKDGPRSRNLLRLDAFLGEWLSPDYFENITPPPESKMMLAAARADLLRINERSDPLAPNSDLKLSAGNFPGGWGSKKPLLNGNSKPAPRDPSVSSESEQAPKLTRSKTQASSIAIRRLHGHIDPLQDSRNSSRGDGYTAPVPPYAVLPTQPIPQGYVAHACDACTKVDYNWNSIKPPLEWGDGGQYGEEWSALHRRFRKGLSEMLSWYREHSALEEPKAQEVEPQVLQKSTSQPSGEAGEDDAETVLILVTHGSGCNALIGALTNQPVLIDVGLTSITMAVRRDNSDTRLSLYGPNTVYRRRASYDQGIADEYEVKMTASVDHLRPGSQYLGSKLNRIRSPSLPIREKSPYRYERHVRSPTRRDFNQSSVRKTSPPVPTHEPRQTEPKRTPGGSFEEIVTKGSLRLNAASTTTSNGLWSKPEPPKPSPLSQITQEVPKAQATPAKPVSDSESHQLTNGDTTSQNTGGLWTANPRAIDQLRDQTKPKRRWTSGPPR